MVEAKALNDGVSYLVDPGAAAVLYRGGAQFASDPYTGLSANTTRFRLEFNVLFRLRNTDAIGEIGAS